MFDYLKLDEMIISYFIYLRAYGKQTELAKILVLETLTLKQFI